MRNREKLKKDVTISSSELVDFLKQERLYVRDNAIVNSSTNVLSLTDANETSISWIGYDKYDIENLKSNILIVNQSFQNSSDIKTIIYTTNPKLAIVLIINHFFLEVVTTEYISKLASIDSSAKIGKNCIINEYVVIGENCIIGDNVTLYPSVVLYPETIIGDNVIINAGATIGQDGLGHIEDLEGNYIQFPHVGRVIIQRDVVIGSGTCIDRGVLSDTVVGEGTKIDNYCTIAHNVKVGKKCLITGKACISGSATIEDGVYIGPNSVIIGNITIGKNAVIGMGAIIRKDVKASTTMVPFEAMEKRVYIKALRKIKN